MSLAGMQRLRAHGKEHEALLSGSRRNKPPGVQYTTAFNRQTWNVVFSLSSRSGGLHMWSFIRPAATAALALLVLAGLALAADKEVTGKVVKVNLKQKTITVDVPGAGQKVYDVNDDTKFIGPKGGISDAGIKDDRLVKGAEIKLLIAGNNRTIREVHLPVRSKEN
jgi:hypothetical protein